VSAPPGKGAAVAGIDVLLDPAHEGKIYVGGIFALPWATLKGIGLDYTGGEGKYAHTRASATKPCPLSLSAIDLFNRAWVLLSLRSCYVLNLSLIWAR